MRQNFTPNPEQEMLERFNAAERERLLPVWRRASFRIKLATLAVGVFALWAIAVWREVYR